MPSGEYSEFDISRSWNDDSWDGDDAGSDAEETEEALERGRSEDSFARVQRALIRGTRESMGEADDALSRLDSDFDESSFTESRGDSSRFVGDGSEKGPGWARELFEKMNAAEEARERSAQEREARERSARRRYLMISAGLVLTGVLAVVAYRLWLRYAEGKGDADLADQVPEEVRARLRELAEKWRDEKDEVFWRDFADAIDAGLVIDGERQEFTLADQAVFLNFTIELSPLRDVWVWDSAADMEENAEALGKLYEARGRVSDIYRHALEVTYRGERMPRAIAAEQIQIAIARIALEREHDRADAHAGAS